MILKRLHPARWTARTYIIVIIAIGVIGITGCTPTKMDRAEYIECVEAVIAVNAEKGIYADDGMDAIRMADPTCGAAEDVADQ